MIDSKNCYDHNSILYTSFHLTLKLEEKNFEFNFDSNHKNM